MNYIHILHDISAHILYYVEWTTVLINTIVLRLTIYLDVKLVTI